MISVSAVLHGSAYASLLAGLIWAPLPLASNRPWALALLAMLLWAGLAAAAGARLLRATGRAATTTTIGSATAVWLQVACAAGFCGVVLAQVVWGTPDARFFASQDLFQTRHYLLRALVFVAALALVALTVTSHRRAVGLLGAVFGSGLLQAALAVALYSTGSSYEYFFEDFTQGGRATGTFANSDHLAGYMELTLAAGLGLLVMQFSGARPGQGWRQRVVEGVSFLMSGKMLLRLGLVALVVALVMTHSRMGNGAFFISLLLVGALVAARSPRLRRPALWLVASMAVVDIFIIGQWVGLDRVVQRMQGTAEASSQTIATFGLQGPAPQAREESLAQRLEIPRLSLQLISDRPWFGYGGGSYALAFAPRKPAAVFAGLWDHAHNDYVQVAVDTGLVGLTLWLGIGLVAAVAALRLLRDGQPHLNQGVGVAALMALSCLGLHSMVDFNLHIPANALTFAVLLALAGVVSSTRTRRRSGRWPDSADADN